MGFIKQIKKINEVMTMKEHIINFLKLIGIGTVVTLSWEGLEMVMLGAINPNSVDSIVGLILSYSLYYNLKYWKENTSEK
jgi:hypothetical protein